MWVTGIVGRLCGGGSGSNPAHSKITLFWLIVFFLNGAKFVGHIKVLVNVLMFVGFVTLHGLFVVYGFNVGPLHGRGRPSRRPWVQLPPTPLM